MRTLILILAIFCMTLFTSCDCRQNVTGTVIDANTSQPIQGVRLHKQNKDYDKDESDEKGKFAIKSISGGLFGCPPMTIIVSKDGYETKTVEIENTADFTVKLQKVE